MLGRPAGVALCVVGTDCVYLVATMHTPSDVGVVAISGHQADTAPRPSSPQEGLCVNCWCVRCGAVVHRYPELAREGSWTAGNESIYSLADQASCQPPATSHRMPPHATCHMPCRAVPCHAMPCHPQGLRVDQLVGRSGLGAREADAVAVGRVGRVEWAEWSGPSRGCLRLRDRLASLGTLRCAHCRRGWCSVPKSGSSRWSWRSTRLHTRWRWPRRTLR